MARGRSHAPVNFRRASVPLEIVRRAKRGASAADLCYLVTLGGGAGVGAEGARDAGGASADAGGEAPVPPTIVVFEPALRPRVECAPLENGGARDDGDINVDLATKFQRISGYGGMNQPRWITDLTPEQTLTAFGDGPTQLC